MQCVVMRDLLVSGDVSFACCIGPLGEWSGAVRLTWCERCVIRVTRRGVERSVATVSFDCSSQSSVIKS